MPLLCPAGVLVLKKNWETAVGARKSCYASERPLLSRGGSLVAVVIPTNQAGWLL
jgi:hypothetical protein